MKIQYITGKNIKLNLDLSIIDYLKNLTKDNLRSFKTWENAKFSLIDDNKNIIWTREFRDIVKEGLSAHIDEKIMNGEMN